MEIRIEREKKYFSEDGVVLCEADISLPCAVANEDGKKDGARNTRFYAAVGAAALRLAEKTVLPTAKKALASIPAARRRAVWRPYRLTVTSICHATGDGISLVRTLTVTHRGRVYLTERAEEIITGERHILPQKRARSTKSKKERS